MMRQINQVANHLIWEYSENNMAQTQPRVVWLYFLDIEFGSLLIGRRPQIGRVSTIYVPLKPFPFNLGAPDDLSNTLLYLSISLTARSLMDVEQ